MATPVELLFGAMPDDDRAALLALFLQKMDREQLKKVLDEHTPESVREHLLTGWASEGYTDKDDDDDS